MEIKANQPITIYYRFVNAGIKDFKRKGDFSKLIANAMTTPSGGGNISGSQIIDAILKTDYTGQLINIECLTFNNGLDVNSGVSSKVRITKDNYYFMYIKEDDEGNAVLFVDVAVTDFIIKIGDEININYRYATGNSIYHAVANGEYENKIIFVARTTPLDNGGISKIELVKLIKTNCMKHGAEGITINNIVTGKKSTGYFTAFSSDSPLNGFIQYKDKAFNMYIDIIIVKE